MHIDTLQYDNRSWGCISDTITDKAKCDVVFLFGDSDMLQSSEIFAGMRTLYPNAAIVGASSSGNVAGTTISTSPIVATAVQLHKGSVAIGTVDFTPQHNIPELAIDLIRQLPAEGLRHIFILSDGLNINGSELVKGVNAVANGVSVSGGMAGDGDRFQQTWIIANEAAKQRRIVAIGFYGTDLVISTGCHGGWSPFGAERLVTRSVGNVLYELDNEPALDLYKKYLGEFAAELPNSGMRFPLNIKADRGGNEVIRTLLAIDEQQKSITFAGDIPQGYIARLMKPDLDTLIDGAGVAAEGIDNANGETALGLVVSCVGRRVVMQQLVEEELEAVEEILGSNVWLTGFYSYGEIAPFRDRPQSCELHNQTMTLTAIYER